MTETSDRSVVTTPPHEWIKTEGIETTADVAVPTRLLDQVIGQDEAVAAAEKAARQQRHLMLIGDPGTGKSMIAKAMAEILPPQKLHDVLVFPNPKDPNEPIARELEGGAGRSVLVEIRKKARLKIWGLRILEWGVVLGIAVFGLVFFIIKSDYMALLIGVLVALFAAMLVYQFRVKEDQLVPKLLIENPVGESKVPYVEGTGSHAGALLGDVRHDPFQSGGLETPTHHRVEVGAIHRAHKGVLFIDEINVLRLDSQQALLTAMQDRKYSIVGQSERSSGAMVRTTSIPCDFILVAAGNMDAIKPTHDHLTGLHPALRSRIRGYGYEVYVNAIMDDTPYNRRKLVQFVAQEVKRDGKIPEFRADAIAEVIREAQRRAGSMGKLTLRLRELGGLVRTAGDVARDAGVPLVTAEEVRAAKDMSRGLEQQIIERELKEEQRASGIVTKGLMVGQVTGLVHLGHQNVGEPAGMIVGVEAAVTPALSRDTGDIIPGGALAAEGGQQTLENVGPLLKALKGADIANVDVHVQAHSKNKDAVLEGLGLAVAIAAVSALDRVPVKQDYAVAGLVTIQGTIRRVDAVTQIVESAARAGFAHAVIPESNRADLQIDPRLKDLITVHYASTLGDALQFVLGGEAVPREALLQRVKTAQDAAWVKVR